MKLATAFLLTLTVHAGAVVFTNDTVIPPGNTNYDGQELVISNCTVAVDGFHRFASVRVAAAGTLTHTDTTNLFLPVIISIADEPQLLVGTNAAVLTVSNGIVSSVVVRDLAGTITYSENVDYVLGAVDGQTTLQRTETSTIPDGATVLLSYEVNLGETPAGLVLDVIGDFTLDAGGAVNADGRGFNSFGAGGSSGATLEGGGGGCGGYGGNSANQSPGGAPTGDVQQAYTTGGNGGAGIGGPGGPGGGLIQLYVGGTLQINGTISANGISATNSRAGGGAGGSIVLAPANLSGNGTLSANGGAGEPVRGGGGGGGRIVLLAGTNTFAGTLHARGGAGFVAGGAGTVYLATNSLPAFVLLDNGGLNGTNTDLSYIGSGASLTISGGASGAFSWVLDLDRLLIAPQGRLCAVPTPPQAPSSLMLIVTNAVIQSGGSLSLDGAGYGAKAGLNAGGTYTFNQATTGGGGGGGGYGGAGTNSQAWGGIPSRDSSDMPSSSGGGGGGTISSTNVGGAGGGELRLVVFGTLQLDGSLSADGLPANYYGGGGGGGGSIHLTAGTLAGAGAFSANGGNGLLPGGSGGGGGRIAIHCDTNHFTGTFAAAGGSGHNWGGAGSVFTQVTGQVPGIVLYC
jgi:hypothetical protein